MFLTMSDSDNLSNKYKNKQTKNQTIIRRRIQLKYLYRK